MTLVLRLARLYLVANVVLTAPDFPLYINSRPEILKVAVTLRSEKTGPSIAELRS